MINEYFASADYFDSDSYSTFQAQERELNEAIRKADISTSFEEYLDIFDVFYSDDVEVRSQSTDEPIRGKAGVRTLLFNFLYPLHVMAEIGGLIIQVRYTGISGDTVSETHSVWTIDFIGVSGRTCSLTWRVLRKWNGSRIIFEHHYDYHQVGTPLSLVDLNLTSPKLARRIRRLS